VLPDAAAKEGEGRAGVPYNPYNPYNHSKHSGKLSKKLKHDGIKAI